MVNKVNTGQHYYFFFWTRANISNVLILSKLLHFLRHLSGEESLLWITFHKANKREAEKKGCLNLSRFKANKRQKRKCQEIRDEKVILNGDRDIIKVIIQQQSNANATTNKLRHNFMRWTINVSSLHCKKRIRLNMA